MRIQATTADAYKLFHDGALALARAERQGIRVDVQYCEKKSKQLARRISRYEKRLAGTKLYRRWEHIFGGKTNIYSNHQLSQVLYKHLKIEPIKETTSGQGATDEEALKGLNLPELDLILDIRKLNKVKTTYLDAFLRLQTDGLLHPSFNLHSVRTFRSSSADPNFQNIPSRDEEAMKLCRQAILPRPGHMLLEADFSALEVSISECYHKDPVMMNYLLDKNSDMHLDMAKQIFKLEGMDKKIPSHKTLRQAAKNGFVFPQFYGDYYANNAHSICNWVQLSKGNWSKGEGIELPSGETIAKHLRDQGIKNFDQFTEHLKGVEDDFWNRRFRGYHNWRRKSVERYRKKGWLQMHTGFICSGPMRRNEIVNYPIQGSAFHCLLKTFIGVDTIMREEQWNSRLIGQIHDSIIMDVHPDELERVEQTLYNVVEQLPKVWEWIIIPLEIEIDKYEVDKPWV